MGNGSSQGSQDRLSVDATRAPTEGWWDMASAPKDGTEIQALIPGHGSDNVIAWQAGLVDEGEKIIGAWTFTRVQEPPDCWTDGWCWASNEDGQPSRQPVLWKPLEARFSHPSTDGEGA